MKTTLFALTIVLAVVLTGCAPRYSVTVDGPRGPSVDAQLVIHDMVARNMIAKEGGGLVLLGVGVSRLDCADPSDVLLARLADVSPPLRPVSYYDQQPNPNAVLIVLGPLAWTSGSEAALSVIRFRYGAGASDGFTAHVKWRDGTWKMVRTSAHWST